MGTSSKDDAIAFLRMAAGGQVREAYERFVGPGFRHHNPWFRGDAESLQAGMLENATKHPDKLFEVKMAIEEGDRVAVLSHLRMKPGERGMSVVHILRFDAGRIVEMWDLGQPIPEDSVNENGMF
jgi:predicted SnoaL-like aldol condensation-catalyzing enzyme